MPRRSIRKSLLLGVTFAVGLVMILGGGVVYVVMKKASLEHFDHGLVDHPSPAGQKAYTRTGRQECRAGTRNYGAYTA